MKNWKNKKKLFKKNSRPCSKNEKKNFKKTKKGK